MSFNLVFNNGFHFITLKKKTTWTYLEEIKNKFHYITLKK